MIAANGATSTIESLGTLVGPLLIGVLISVADAGLVFAAGAGASLLQAACLLRVRVAGAVDLGSAEEGGVPSACGSRGWRTLAHAPRARLVVALIFAQTFVRGCLNVLIVVAAFQMLDAGGAAVGYMTAAIGVAVLIGGLGAVTSRET